MKTKQKYIRWILLALLIFAVGVTQYRVDLLRIREELKSTLFLLPGESITGALLGGFKGFAADIMWIRIDMYWEAGQWYKIMPLYYTIALLQPYFLLVWEMGGWHMAFNMSHYALFPDEKVLSAPRVGTAQLWIEKGISFLKRGILYHPDTFTLYFDVGDTYYRRTHDYLMAAKYFKQASQCSHPDYVDRMLAHAYRKAGMLEASYDVWLRLAREYDPERHSKTHIRVIKRSLKELEKLLGKSP